MQRLLVLVALATGLITHAWGQTYPGQIPPGTLFGNPTGSAAPPIPVNYPVINVKDAPYGAKCDGVTNDATAFNAAIAAANVLSPGGRVIVPPGTCIVGSSIGSSSTNVLSNVELIGSGENGTIIKLANSANTNVIDGDSSLFGGTSNGGVSDFRLSYLTIDGNSSNNTSGDCIKIYGFHFNLSNIKIRNCAQNGLHTEFGGNIVDLEANFLNIQIDTTGNHGFWFNGPHDSNIDMVLTVDAGQATNNTWDGILIDTKANCRCRHLHPYHRSTATNRMKYAIEDNGGGSNVSDSNFEGANIPALINSQKNTYINNSWYAAWNGAGTLIVKQSENVIVGVLGDPGAGRPATKGLILGQGGDNASVNSIDIVVSNQNLGAIDLTNSAGNNKIYVKGFQTSGAGFVGAPNAGDSVEIEISGNAAPFHLIQKPTHIATSGASPVPTSCGTGPTINGTDMAGIVSTGTGATGCTLTFASPYVSSPFCVVGSQQNASTPAYIRSATQLILGTGTAASSFYHYICIAQPGG